MKFYPKYHFPCMILLLIFSAEFALGHSIKGSVVDSKGNPVSFATIFIREMDKGITTGESGTFSIPLESGTYTLKFQCVGYQPEIRQVKLTTMDQEVRVVAESHNQVTYVAPDRYTQKVLKTEKSGTIFEKDAIPGVEFLTVSVYQPKYRDVPSPLGKNAFNYYSFYLSGISVMGNYSIYKIKVRP